MSQIKSIEIFIRFLQASDNRSFLGDDSDEDSDMETDADEPVIKLRRAQYTMNVLRSWYAQRYPGHESVKPKICIIIPNFEEFKPAVIVDLITILRQVYLFDTATALAIKKNISPPLLQQPLPGDAVRSDFGRCNDNSINFPNIIIHRNHTNQIARVFICIARGESQSYFGRYNPIAVHIVPCIGQNIQLFGQCVHLLRFDVK